MQSPLLRAFIPISLAALALSGTASAQTVVPPENSAVNQYTESFPSAGGNVPSGGIGGKHGGSPAKVLGKAQAARLRVLGPTGRATAQLAAAGVPGTVDAHPGSGAPGAPGKHWGSASGANLSGESGLKQVLSQITGTSGSGEMGLLLPLLISMAVVVAIAFAMGKRRATPAGK